MYWRSITVGLAIIFLILSGCSSGTNPSTPPLEENISAAGSGVGKNTVRTLWGYYTIEIDTQTLENSVVPIRTGSLHLNTVMFLEPPTGSTIQIRNLSIDETNVSCDISLTHPFPGLDMYTGFDVRGILIGSGSISGINDSSVVYAGIDELRLVNADGWTRWWNPVEFADNGSMFSYRDGKLGIPDDIGGFNATINGYKYFADCLELEPYPFYYNLFDPDIPPELARGVFTAGSVNVRHYDIHFEDNGSGDPLLIFNYAVDACWEAPNEPFNVVPDDFPITANCPEPVLAIHTQGNTLYYDPSVGGGGSIEIGVYATDWQAIFGEGDVSDQVAGVSIEFPELSDDTIYYPDLLPYACGQDDLYSGWITDIALEPDFYGRSWYLVTVESSVGDYQPDFTGYAGISPLAAYFVGYFDISSEAPSMSTLTLITPNGGEMLRQCPFDIEWTSDGDPIDNVTLEYSMDDFLTDVHLIIGSTPNDGNYEWDVPDIDSETLRVRVSAVGAPEIYDISDNDFSVSEPGPALWPTQKYNYQRNGQSPYSGPTTNNLLWNLDVYGEMTPGPVIGDDGIIYTGTNDGRFLAVSPDGELLWELSLGSYVLGSASITEDGIMYVGSWGGATGYLHAIECEGDILWEFDCGGNINHATPVIGSDGTIYIGNNNGDFFAINPEGSQKWMFDIPGGGFTPSPALGSDGTIYVCSTNGHTYGLTDNGQDSYTIAWDREFAGEHLGCPPTVDTDNPLVSNDVVYVSGLYDNTLYACDPVTDTILWMGLMPRGTTETSATIGDDHTVYIGCNDGLVYAFNQGGSVKWTFPTGQQVTAAPIIDPEGRIYVPSRDNWIYCLDSSDGSEIWSFETNNFTRTEVAIAPNGTLYCGGHDGILRAFRDE